MKDDEYLVHYGVLGMKWGIRRQGKRAARFEKKTLKVQKKIDAENKKIEGHKESLNSENIRSIKSKARVLGYKNEIRQLNDKIKNEDYGLLFRKSKEKQAKEDLEEAQGNYKKALDMDLEIESNRANLRANIQAGKDQVAAYQSKQTKYITKANIARGKEAAKKIKLDALLAEKERKKK